jgi:hypothetical protein
LIGSLRRECLDHVIAFDEIGLRRILKDYFQYYDNFRTHLSLNTSIRGKLPERSAIRKSFLEGRDGLRWSTLKSSASRHSMLAA